MNLRSLLTLFVSALCTLPALAQDNCPMEATRRVPLDVRTGPAQNCGGLDWRLGEVQVSTVRDACPLFVIVTPEHDVATPSKQRTLVEPIATVAVVKVTFECVRDYFLFIPIGSRCVFGKQLNLSVLHLMVTRPCAIVEPE